MLPHYIIALYLLLIGLVGARETDTQDEDLSFKPRGRLDLSKGLRIMAYLTTYRYEQSKRLPMDRLKVEEQHSRALKSAHLRYSRLNKKDERSHEFYSLDRQHIVAVDRAGWSCERKDHRTIFIGTILSEAQFGKTHGSIMSVFSSQIARLMHGELTEPNEQNVGIARLILLLDLNKDKLKPYPYSIYVREQLAAVYEMTLNLDDVMGKESKSFKIIASFGVNNKLRMTESDLPIRIEVSSGLGGPMDIMVDLLQVEPLKHEKTQVESHELSLSASTVDPRFGCAEVLGTLSGINNLRVPRVASMHFQAVDLLAGKLSLLDRQFVAYDGHLMALRRDVINDSYYSTTIHDLKRDKKFNVRRMSQNNADSCIVAQTTSSTYEPIIPLIGLVSLGTAYVRGVEVDVYEHYSCGLPALFYSSFKYVSQMSDQQVSDNEQYLRLIDDGYNSKSPNSLKSLSVVYYFARSITSNEPQMPGPLMRLEVYLARSGKLLSRVEVQQFSWSLQQAPNGDQAHELFFLPEDCTKQMGSAAQLKLKLNFKREHNKMINPSELHSIYMQDSRQRDYAIKSSLVQQTSLASTQMGFFRSSLQSIRMKSDEQDHEDLQVSIYFKMIQVSQHVELHLSQPSESVSVRPRKLSKLGRRAANFEECFFEAAHERKNGPLLFAFIEGVCYIDTKPIYEPEDGGRLKFTYSNVFDILRADSENGPRAKEILMATVKLADGQPENQLRGKILIVPVRLSLSPYDKKTAIQTAIFDIAEVEIEQTSSLMSRDDLSWTRKLLDNVRLSQGDLISSESFAYKTSTENLDQCHAICLADFQCRSFSICLQNSRVQCMTSELRLDKADVLQKIEQQQRSQNRSQTLLDGKLKLDNKCRTFSKQPLKMFHALGPQITNLNPNTIIYTESLDECAFKCLATNSMQQLRGSLNSSVDDYVSSRRNSFKASLQSNWCTSFYYVALATLNQHVAQVDWPNLLKILGVDRDQAKRGGGICSMDARIMKKLKQQDDSVSLSSNTLTSRKIDARTSSFQLNFESLYERKPGVRLRGYQSQDAQSSNYVQNIIKFVPVATPELCARACFMQTGELLPICKSFDFTYVRSSRLELSSVESGFDDTQREFWQRRYMTAKRCMLNSMTLAQAKSSGHYEQLVQVGRGEDEDESVVAWHFEPHEAFAIDDAIVRQAFSTSLGDDFDQSNLDRSHVSLAWLGVFTNLFIVVIAITSGLIIAKNLAKLTSVSSLSGAGHKRESIVRLAPLTLDRSQ